MRLRSTLTILLAGTILAGLTVLTVPAGVQAADHDGKQAGKQAGGCCGACKQGESAQKQCTGEGCGKCKGGTCSAMSGKHAGGGKGMGKHHAMVTGNLSSVLDQIAAARKAIQSGDTKAALAALDKAETTLSKTHQSIASRHKGTDKPKGIVNTACPIMGAKIDADKVPAKLTREYKGQKIGFCCAGCPEAWDKLSDDAKASKLQAVTPKHAHGKGHHAEKDAPAVVNRTCPIMGSKIDPENVPSKLTREYKGQKVGFCCGGCPAAWDKLSDEQKAAKLNAATK